MGFAGSVAYFSEERAAPNYRPELETGLISTAAIYELLKPVMLKFLMLLKFVTGE